MPSACPGATLPMDRKDDLLVTFPEIDAAAQTPATRPA